MCSSLIWRKVRRGREGGREGEGSRGRRFRGRGNVRVLIHDTLKCIPLGGGVGGSMTSEEDSQHITSYLECLLSFFFSFLHFVMWEISLYHCLLSVRGTALV